MITCPKCHARLEDGSRFCDSCGAPIPEQTAAETASSAKIFCPHCGKQVGSENPFCPDCGKPLEEKIFCSNCGKQVGTASNICPNCSSRLYDEVFCPNCGKPSGSDAAFCKNCGTPFHAAAPKPEQKKKKEKKKQNHGSSDQKTPSKGIIFAGIGILLAAACILVFVLIGGGTGSSSNYAMYVKDKEIYYTGFSRKDPWQVTSRFVDGGDIDNFDLADAAYFLADACRLSEDGSLLFFPDKISYSDNGYSLYYRQVNKPKEDAVKIDSDIISYSVSKDASAITYQKNDTLYQYDRKKEDKQKVASDIRRYYVSDDGKTILYLNTEDVLYSTVRGGDREKIDSEISALSYVSEDLSTLVYIKEGTLYKKVGSEDKVKISSDVDHVIAAYDSGEVYYVKSESMEVPLSNYVYDDKKEADAVLTEPKSPNWIDPDYDAKYEAYQKASEEYRAKLFRDNLRKSLNEEKIEQTDYSLCYYNGEEETVIHDSFIDSSYPCAADSPVITYTAYDQSDDIRIKLSETEDIYSIRSFVTEALISASERYVTVGSTSSLLDREEAQHFRLSADGETLFYLDEVPEDKDYGELYQVSISSSGELGSPELYDSDVYTGTLHFIDAGKLLYFKDYKNDKGELYIDREKIDYDVNFYSIQYMEDQECVTYYTDWNDEKNYGTLKIYTGKDAQKIADDVHSHFVLPNGEVLYLYDYSPKYYHGDLYLWNKKDTEKIDDSVVCILPVY